MEATPFWGTPTASVDWCETNYEVCHFIAEFWNTITSSFISVLGLLGLYLILRERIEKRFAVLYAGIVVIGLGSVAFHGALLLEYQLLDELPMIWTTLTWVYIYQTMESPRKGRPQDAVLAKRLAIFAAIWTVGAPWVHFHAPLAFQSLFVGLMGYSMMNAHKYYKVCNNPTARTMYIIYNMSLAAGACIWLIDTHACNKLHYLFGSYWWHKYVGSLHGYWHCFMSLNVYLGPVFAAVVRAQCLDVPASIKWWGPVPYVKRDYKKIHLSAGPKSE
jgi:dihydroceramidase